MRTSFVLTPILLLALAAAGIAQTPPDTTTTGTPPAPAQPVTSKQEPAPNYSKQTLMRIFVEEDKEDGENLPRDPFDVGLVYTAGEYRFRFVPLLTPFYLNATMPSAHVSPSASLTIDPFNMLHTEAAYTSNSIQDPLKQWKFRRMLKKNEKAAKKERGDN
jgi:hypothetical protein